MHLYLSTVGVFPDCFFGFAMVEMGWGGMGWGMRYGGGSGWRV